MPKDFQQQAADLKESSKSCRTELLFLRVVFSEISINRSMGGFDSILVPAALSDKEDGLVENPCNSPERQPYCGDLN